MAEISTSLLSVKKEDIIKTIYNLETAGTNYFHIDVMDGKFVQDNTNEIMREYCEYVTTISNLPLDVHLMVEDVENYIKSYLIFNPNIITFHYEAIDDKEQINYLINFIKENNCKVGLSIKPETDIAEIYKFLPFIHLVLVMTVEPGKGGQSIIPETIEKISQLSKYINDNNIEVDIEVDGGININNVEQLKKAGANIIVSGTGIISTDDYKQTIKKMLI